MLLCSAFSPNWFARHGSRVTGIDLSEVALGEARSYADQQALDSVSFEKRSVLATGLPGGHFDLVYCTGVLHHTASPFDGLSELHRVLRPGGKLLLSLYNWPGCLPRELRRRAVALLAGNDSDARVAWGRRLFPLTSRRLLAGDRNDRVAALYDYFAIPYQTLHSAGEVLRWFDRLGLDYAGSFAPLRLGDYVAMASQASFATVEPEYRPRILQFLGRHLPARELLRARPGVLSRGVVQLIWLLAGVGVFCICGRKR